MGDKIVMLLDEKKSSDQTTIDKKNKIPKSETPQRPPHRNRNRSRWSKKRKRSSSPTALLLHDDDWDETNLEDDETDSRPKASSPIPWSTELHRAFVNAVFEIGIEQSSPAVIAEQMITKNNYNTLYPADSSQQRDKKSNKNHESSTPGTSDGRPNVLPTNHNVAVATAAALAIIGENETKKSDSLPEEAEYYKRELTGERLKSHLQKMRKQKDREKDVFLGDYNRFLNRQEIVDREQKQIEKVKEKRKEESRRRQSKKRYSRNLSATLLDASAFDRLDGKTNGVGQYENNKEDEEEEERLLSMYLPLRLTTRQAELDLDFEFDGTENTALASFPTGGRAIGMVTWAVRQQEEQDRKRRAQKRQLALQHHHQQYKYHPSTPNGWDSASVDSLTSHTAIAAGKLATALGRRGDHQDPEGQTTPGIIDCGSSEDDHTDTDTDDSEEGEYNQFKAFVPTLTEAEKNSPLGVSLRLTWDMIQHMHGVIAEERASKIKEQELQKNIKAQLKQQQQQQGSPKTTKNSTEDSSSENNQLPQIPATSKTEPEGHLAPNTAGNEAERVLKPMTNQERKDSHLVRNHPTPAAAAAAAAASMLDHQVWSAPANPHLLAAMAANGTPPTQLVQALSGAVLEEKPLLLAPFLGNPASVVTPPSQTKGGPWNPSSKPTSAFTSASVPTTTTMPTTTTPSSLLEQPLFPPKDVFAFLNPASRSHSPMVSLSTPTTPAEAMFRSLLQHSQQSKEQHHPV